ncbi:methyltransferase domain-containing protein [Streptomyces sp. NPDC050617]|uniref:methyltransferase domain-containing protein n=1 Tax=Streptomyces sp. NPDC050617 TaxID=3154628 RepID=UPI003426EB24
MGGTDRSTDLRAGLVRELLAGGALADPRWRAAFEEVPRHVFVPYFYLGVVGGYERLWGEDPDPRRRERWLTEAYADAPLATRLRDGELVSSSSQPSLMARMLEYLDVRDGHTVLEVGAGTGYNAALLAHRLGDENVTTVDLDPEITETARNHLAAAGRHPAVVTGDGVRGCPARAPFDRIMATCAMTYVPPAWLTQCRPDALVLAPLATGLIALRVLDAEHAAGSFLATPAYFVPLRGGGAAPPVRGDGLPRRLPRNDDFRFLLALTAGRLDPVEALDVWRKAGEPGRERFGVTVRGSRQWAWLDDPDGPYNWPLEARG